MYVYVCVIISLAIYRRQLKNRFLLGLAHCKQICNLSLSSACVALCTSRSGFLQSYHLKHAYTEGRHRNVRAVSVGRFSVPKPFQSVWRSRIDRTNSHTMSEHAVSKSFKVGAIDFTAGSLGKCAVFNTFYWYVNIARTKILGFVILGIEPLNLLEILSGQLLMLEIISFAYNCCVFFSSYRRSGTGVC